MFGQSAPASESRIRCPGSNTQDVASSSSSTTVGWPGTSGAGALDDSRCARFRRPRVTSADVPSGKTSQSFAERNATGTAEVMVDGEPRVAQDLELLVEAAPTRRRASARRPRAGRSAGPTAAARRRRSRPLVPTSPRSRSSSVPSAGSGRSTIDPRRARAATPARSATRRASPRGRAPAASSGARRPGSAARPRSRSARRGASARTSGRAPERGRCAGPGSEVAVDMWLHGPTSSRFGHRAPRTCGRCCCGSRRPSRRRASSGTRCARTRAGASRAASTGRRPAPRASAAATARAVDPAEPLVAPAVAEDRRHRRQDVQRRHVEHVVDEVEPAQRAARVVDVVGVAVVRRVDRADRAERGRALDRRSGSS